MTVWQNLGESASNCTQTSCCLSITHLTTSGQNVIIVTAATRSRPKCFTVSSVWLCLRLSLKIINYLMRSMKVQLRLGTKSKLSNTWIMLKTRVKYVSLFAFATIPLCPPTLQLVLLYFWTSITASVIETPASLGFPARQGFISHILVTPGAIENAYLLYSLHPHQS